MSKTLAEARKYPFTRNFDGRPVTLRMMTPQDGKRIQRLATLLHDDDRLFLRMDLTRTDVIKIWCENIRHGRTDTILAIDEHGDAVGYGSVHHDDLLWTRHIGELRLLVTPEYRGCGLGKMLAHEAAEVAQGKHLARLVVHVPRDKPHVQHMLIRLGFNAEALLTDWLMDRDEKLHDMLVMARWLDASPMI